MPTSAGRLPERPSSGRRRSAGRPQNGSRRRRGTPDAARSRFEGCAGHEDGRRPTGRARRRTTIEAETDAVKTAKAANRRARSAKKADKQIERSAAARRNGR